MRNTNPTRFLTTGSTGLICPGESVTFCIKLTNQDKGFLICSYHNTQDASKLATTPDRFMFQVYDPEPNVAVIYGAKDKKDLVADIKEFFRSNSNNVAVF
jgi:hypothetical protein